MVEKIKQVFYGPQGLRSATILLAVTLFLSNVLGLLRNILLATQAHSLSELDPYYAAFRLPDLIFNLLVLGAISSAFIPVYTKVMKEHGNDEANQMASTLLGNLIVLVLVSIVVLWFLLPGLIPLLLHKFSDEQQQLTVHLARIMLLSPLFFCLSYVEGAVLNAHKRFVSYSIAPLIYNVSIIGGALLLPRFGVEGVAWSVVAGAFLHFLIQLPSVLRAGFTFHLRVDWKNSHVGTVFRLMIPRSFSLGLAQIILLGFTVIASTLRPGALAIFSLANDFQTTPAILFGASLATAVFPTLSEAVAEKSPEQFQHYLGRTIRISLFTLIPLTILIFVLRAQITRLYVGLGHHSNWEETIRTINTLAWFSFSFLAQGIVFILARAFYALQDTRRPLYASFIAGVVTIILAILLPKFGYFSAGNRADVAALAAAYTIGMWVQALALIWWFPKQWLGPTKNFIATLPQVILASVVAGFVAWLTLQVVGEGVHTNQLVPLDVPGIGTRSVLRLLTQGTAAALLGFISYWLITKWFGCEELKWMMQLKKGRNSETAKEQ